MAAERTATGWAARSSSDLLSPYTYTLRKTGPEDVFLRVICCGICLSDVALAKDSYAFTKYPFVPGHEVVGEVEEVGSEVTKFKVGDHVGVGFVVGSCNRCELCKSDRAHYCDSKINILNDVYYDGKPTHGGLATAIVVNHRFLAKIPDGMAAEQAAPLLCSGITAYSPLIRFGLNKNGLRGGVLGLGGMGHISVILVRAMGHHVTVISSSVNKRDEALTHLGAHEFVLSSDSAQMKSVANSLDYIIDTVPVFHPLEPYFDLLKVDGNLILLGAPNTPLQFSVSALDLKRISINGSFIGTVREMEELFNFFHDKGLTSMIEMVTMDEVNEAFRRLDNNDVKYKFVVDVAGTKTL